MPAHHLRNFSTGKGFTRASGCGRDLAIGWCSLSSSADGRSKKCQCDDETTEATLVVFGHARNFLHSGISKRSLVLAFRTCLVRPLAALSSLAGRALACMPVPLRGRAACRTNFPLHLCHRPNEIGSYSLLRNFSLHSSASLRN